MNRLLAIGSFMMGCHFLILSLPLLPLQISNPTLEPVKRIAVSFISRPTPPKEIKKQTIERPPENQDQKRIVQNPSITEKVVSPVDTKEKRVLKKEHIIKKPVDKPIVAPQKEIATQKTEQKKLTADTAPQIKNKQPETDNEQATQASAQVIQEVTPLYKINPPPAYPRLARRRGLEGLVLINVLIDITGHVVDLKLTQSSGHTILDKAALKSVKNWNFTPGNKGNTPLEMWVTVPVHFKLTSK